MFSPYVMGGIREYPRIAAPAISRWQRDGVARRKLWKTGRGLFLFPTRK